MITTLIVLAYIALCASSGYYLISKIEGLSLKSLSSRLAISFAVGAMLEMLLAHGIAHITDSFRLATYITLGVMLLAVIASKVITKAAGIATVTTSASNDGLNPAQIATAITALALGLIYGIRDHLFGNPDRAHNANYANIANNNIYPPAMPIDIDFSACDYHYGTHLMGATMKIITGLSAWEAQSIQMGLWVMAFVLASAALIEHYVKSPWLALYGALLITGFTTSGAYIFLIKDGLSFFSYDISVFLLDWIKATWTSISSVNTQLRLGSQNMGLGIFISAILLIIKKLDQEPIKVNDKLYYFTILLLSFGLYFIYPSLYYPLIAALAALTAIYLLKSLASKNYWSHFKSLTITTVIFYIGKILTGTSNSSAIGGIKTLVFALHDKWINWGKPYLLYFSDAGSLQKLSHNIDPVTGVSMLEIPLWSWISFIDFADLMLVASIIATCMLLKHNFYIDEKLNSSLLFLLAGAASTLASFSIVFLPRPIETTRFLLWGKVCCLVFISIVLMQYAQKQLDNWSRYKGAKKISLVVAAVFLTLGLVPGLAAIYPASSLNFLGNKSISKEDQALLQDLEKLQKSGDIVLDSRIYEIGATMSNLAGFYSIGGQIYKEDQLTRETALRLMSPRLLSELKVCYVLINPGHTLSEQANKRLSDKELFTEITSITTKHPGYHFYRFNQVNEKLLQLKEPKQEHIWALVYQSTRTIMPAQNKEGKLVSASSKEGLSKATADFKHHLAEKEPLVALWIRPQAFPTTILNHD